jgi:hypothetical protein
MVLLDLQALESRVPEAAAGGSSNSPHSCQGSELSVALCGETSDLSVLACGH